MVVHETEQAHGKRVKALLLVREAHVRDEQHVAAHGARTHEVETSAGVLGRV